MIAVGDNAFDYQNYPKLLFYVCNIVSYREKFVNFIISIVSVV